MLGFIKKIFSPVNGQGKRGITLEKARRDARLSVIEDVERFGVEDYELRTGKNKRDTFEDYMQVYERSVWTYVCVNVIARSAASVKWKILKNVSGDRFEEDRTNPIIKVLKRPNRFMNWNDLVERTFQHLETTGNSFWEEVRSGTANDLVHIYSLQPDKMEIIPDAKKYVRQYIYWPVFSKSIEFDPEDVTHFRYQSPLSEYWGISPLDAAQNSITLEFWTIAFNKKFFKNRAVPEVALETDQSLTDQAYRRLREEWMKRFKGVENAFGLTVLEEGLKAKVIDRSQNDMQFIEQRKMNREEILAAHGVPPVLVGLLEYSSYSNALEQKMTFWQNTMIPKLRRFEDFMNRDIMPEGYSFAFDYAEIEALIEDVDLKTRMLESMVTKGILTINEARERLHLKPVSYGNTAYLSVGLANANEIMNHKLNEGGVGTERQKPEDQVNNPDKIYSKPFENPSKEPTPEVKKRLEKIQLFKGELDSEIKAYEKTVRAFFAEQESETVSRLEKKFSKSFKIKKDKDDDPDEFDIEFFLIDVQEENAKLKKISKEQFKRTTGKFGKQAVRQVGANVAFDLEHPEINKFFNKWSASKVSGINRTTEQQLRDTLEEGRRNGEDFDQFKTRINDVFSGTAGDARVKNIARTENVTWANNGRLEGYKQSGVVKEKEWVSELLPTTRDSHEEAHGTVIGINEKFRISNRKGGVDLMDGPGDPDGSAENVCQCFCTVEPVIDDF